MSLELGRKESVPDGIRRIISERIEDSLGVLRTGFSEETIHTVRKDLKEVRAALRLVRYDMGDNLFRQENAVFRDATQPLSEVRDADVMITTLDQLLQQLPEEVPPEKFRLLREALSERRIRIRERILGSQRTIKRTEVILQDALPRSEKLPIRHRDWKAIKSGLKKSYNQGRQSMAEALEEGSDETMHEWRKRVKYQRHHIEILRECRKKIMMPLLRRVRTLADLLGEDHDLVLVRKLADGEMSDKLEKKQREILLAVLSGRQRKLRGKAAKLGRLLYAESGKEFVSRVHEYWQVWR